MKTKNSSSVFLIKNNRILMQLRDNKPSIFYPNHWGLVGGAIELNESPEQALRRETEEEIGLKLNNLEYLGEVRITSYSKARLQSQEIEYEFTNYKGKLFRGKTFLPKDIEYTNHVLYFFKEQTTKCIEDMIVNEGQRVNYFSFEELKNIKLVPILKKFIYLNKPIIFI